ncbi:anion exchange protein 4 isoform B [Patagioenas fasciata monilis]|uniref:Anion exchange protein n=1 Tax=Patagioenas fasciata monilis TaxID=372326 RepID=A0A1V4KV34_PATFA|nr:anion exchange protein 4 isoform B [Patagioenas fasciata monilis]
MTSHVPGADEAALQAADASSQPRPEESKPEAAYHAFGCSIFPSSMGPAAEQAGATLQREEWGDITYPLLFIQLNQLFSTPAGLEWRETARWIKFEEKVEDGGERWSAPHVPALPLHSLFQLRTCLQKGTVLLDLDAPSFKEIIGKAKSWSEPGAQLSKTPLKEQLRNRFKKKIPPGAEAAHIAVGEVEFLEKPFSAFIRLRQGVALGSLSEVALPSRFLFILLGPRAKAKAYHEVGRAMATLLTDEVFQRVARQAEQREDLIAGMEAFLDELTVLPPGKWDPSTRIPPPSCLPSPHRRTTVHQPDGQSHGNGDIAAAGDRAGLRRAHSREELERTGRLFGGLLQDIRRKARWYGSDFSDGLHPQCLSAVLYIYLATVTNAITFGGMLGDATANMQGVLESFLGTAFAGFVFCLFSGQPLTILSSTGPVLVFERLLFSFSQDYGLDYLEFRLWIGLWVAFFGVVLVATEASHLVRYFTRFTEEGFCALISLIFIYDSLKKMLSLADTFPINWQYRLDNVTSYSCICNLSSPGHSSTGNDTPLPSPLAPWQPPAALAVLSRTQCLDQGGYLLGTSCQYVPDVTLFSFLLFGGTFLSCTVLKRFRSSHYFPVGVRKVVSDFAIILAILTSCAVDAALGLETPKLLVPSELKVLGGGHSAVGEWPTNPARGWIIFPFGANPWWVCLVSMVPAVLVTILIFMDQQITAVILNRREYKLQKGAGFHLDLLCVSLLMVVTSVTGLPWYVSATVISLAHMESLRKESTTSAPGEHPKFLGIREQRLTGLAVFVLTGVSVFMAPVLKHIPMPVLYGVFLYMGVAALNSIQLTDRVRLLLMPAKHQPDLAYLRHVPLRRVHLFTIIQLLCLALLWVLKSTMAAIIFPVMLLALVGIRKGLERIFSLHDLSWLDSLLPETARKETDGKQPREQEEESNSEEVESFILDQEDLDNPVLKTTSELFLSSAAEGADLRTVDPETQARLEALLEAAGIGKLSTADGKAFADPEVLRRLTSSVSCALDEAAAALTRMRAENNHNAGQVDNRSLAEACSDGDVNAVRKLLDEGRSVNEHTEEGESLLCLACSAGYYELAQVLLAMHANVEDRGNKGDITPLMAAASGGYVDIVKLLIVHCADVNAQSSTGNTALTYACAGGFVDIVKVLLKAGANIEDHNENGHTPLMEAASAGHVEVARVLLEYGAGINTHSNEFKESALTLACYKGHLDMVRFLLEAGADQEHKTDEMHTALMEACMDGHVEVARLLLDSGAQVNMPADSFESPLTLAACGGHVELAALLIERGANLEEVNDEGYTPLMEAAREGHEEMVALLLAQGANINAQTEETQETALTLACCGGFSEVADFLIKAGADIELGCSTPLMEAAQEGHLELVKYLLAAGANVHATTATGDTALTYACENGHTDVADVLLQAGADLEHESEGGRTPLMKAARAGHLCTVQFLISKGANVNRATANNDHTVVSLACAGGHLAVVELLLAHGADPTHRLKDGSTMLIEAAKGGHTNVVSYLLDYPNNVLSVPAADLSQLTPPSQDQSQVPRVPVHTLAMVVPPQEPDRTPQENSPPLLGVVKGASKQKSSSLQRISAIEKAQLKSLELIQESLELQKALGNQQNVGQQQQIAGQGLLVQEADGLMVATPAQTLTDTLDDLIAAVNSRVPSGSSSSLHTTESPTPEPCSQASSNVPSQSVLPMYPSVDIDAHTESNHDTALTLACAGGHEELVSVLIARGANIEHRDKKGFTPLILAATAGHVGVVEILLDKGGDIEAQSERTKDTPLSLACSGGRQEVVDLLLARGANKEHRNVSDYTPLSLAASGGYVNIIKILLNAGAEINSRTGSKLGISPLMLAAMNGHVPAVKLLLDMGSDINAQIETNRNTALTLACFQGRAEVVSLLLDRKANVEHRAKTGLTPLMEAASGGYAEVGRVLLDKGADVNAPPVPSSRDTALTIAADKGHYKFCELLINRGAHIDVRNKKGNTPLWLAANGGHYDVVQLLVQAGADVDAADNRKITPLMSAFRKGHVKVVQFLVKEVNQFPSDIECMRYIATITDKDLLKKCHQCVETIVKAKDQQAAEANKNATILLKELDLEKSREESRKQALAAKREKRKEKRKKKKEEQKRKQEEDEENKPKETLELQEDDDEEENDDEVEQEVPIEPPSATTTTTIGISATSTTFTNAFGKKRANVVTTPSTNRKNKKNKTKETPQNMQIILPDQHISLAQQKADKNKINGEPRGGGASGNSDSDNLDSTDCNSESSSGSKSQELNFTMDTNASERRYASLLIPAQEEKTSTSASKTPTRREEVDDSEPFSCQVDGQFDLTLSNQRLDGEGHSNSLSNTYKPVSLPLSSPNVKLNLTSPKRGQKREEGWKEVVRRQVGRVLKDPPSSNNLQPTPIEQFQLQRGGRCCSGAKRSKKLSVPASVVSRIMGRGGCNITAIQDVTGAHIDVDKQKDKNGERMITIRGGTESTRYAVQLINALIQDPAKELEDLIPKTHIRTPASRHVENVHPDNSKAPGFRPPSQRVSTSPVGLPSLDPSNSSTTSSSGPLTGFSANIQGARVYLQGPAPVGTPSFNRQHFSPHPWTSATNSCESPIPSVSSGSSSPLSAASAPSNLGQPKTGSANQDRKVPPPIGTERLARIRQGGSVTPTPLGTNFTAPVGHSGIWSFGVNSVSEGLSGWSQPVMGNHPMHQQLSDPGTFSQHQPMERDDSGIVAPSNIFHQPMPNSFVDFSKGLPISITQQNVLMLSRFGLAPGHLTLETCISSTRIIYDRKFLLECKNSPVARTLPCCLPQIPGVISPAQSSLVKLEELKERNESEEAMPDQD